MYSDGDRAEVGDSSGARETVSPADALIVRRPEPSNAVPVLVSVPHFGTLPPDDERVDDYREPQFAHFARGFADLMAAELYGELHAAGATLVASRLSRMFVDLNRRRDHFDIDGECVRSSGGVIRTHTRRGVPILGRLPTLAEVERRLGAYYDPFYRAIAAEVDRLHAAFGEVVVIDAHTGSAERIDPHEIVLGTREGATADERLVRHALEHVADTGLAVSRDVKGYRGGQVVRTFGRPAARRVHAIQFEVNAGLLHHHSYRETVAMLRRGELVPGDAEGFRQVQACITGLVGALGALLAGERGLAPSRA